MINVKLSPSTLGVEVLYPVVCLVRKFRILPPNQSALDSEVESVQEMIARRRASEIPDGRNLFGEKRAHLKLLQNFYNNGFRRHNNLVDAANIVSLSSGVSIGLHDASTVSDDIVVELSSGDETIRPLFKQKSEKVPPGQLIYKSSGRLLAWIGAKDVDSDDFRILETTNSAMIVVLGNEASSEAMNRRACLRVLSLLRLSCPQAYGQIIPTVREKISQSSCMA